MKELYFVYMMSPKLFNKFSVCSSKEEALLKYNLFIEEAKQYPDQTTFYNITFPSENVINIEVFKDDLYSNFYLLIDRITICYSKIALNKYFTLEQLTL